MREPAKKETLFAWLAADVEGKNVAKASLGERSTEALQDLILYLRHHGPNKLTEDCVQWSGDMSSQLRRQFQEPVDEDEEDGVLEDTNETERLYLESLSNIYKYLYNIKSFLDGLNPTTAQYDFLKWSLTQDYRYNDYTDPQGMLTDLEDRVGPHLDEVLNRLKTFINAALDIIIRNFEPGQLTLVRKADPVVDDDVNTLGNAIYKGASDSLSDSFKLQGVTRSKGAEPTVEVGVVGADGEYIPPRDKILRRASEDAEGALTTPKLINLAQARNFQRSSKPVIQAIDGRPKTFRDKWRQLTTAKKVILGTIIGLEIIGIIAVGVLVPGSQLFAIGGSVVITSKIMSLFVGAGVLAATSVAVDRELRDMASINGEGAEARVFQLGHMGRASEDESDKAKLIH